MSAVVKACDAHKKAAGRATVTEFSLPCDNVELALARISGRWPDAGWSVNERVTEIFHVLRGKGSLTVGEKRYALAKGDTALVEPGERYFFEGELEMALACSPRFAPGQQKVVR